MSDPFRGRHVSRAVFALVLSVSLATCSKSTSSESQGNGAQTGGDGPLWNVPMEPVNYGLPKQLANNQNTGRASH